jgi:hypothetical protein
MPTPAWPPRPGWAKPSNPTTLRAASQQTDRGNTIYQSHRRRHGKPSASLSAKVDDEWVADMNKRNFDGKKLLETARALIAKHGRA